jgi:hypothetical protein
MANYRPVEPRLYQQLKDVLAAKRERESLVVLEPQNEGKNGVFFKLICI